MKRHDSAHYLRKLLQTVATGFIAFMILFLAGSSAKPQALQSLLPLAAGHKNVSSLGQIKRYASKYPATPIILGVSAASCGSCGLIEPSYEILSRHMRQQRIPFLRVDADASPELAEQCTGNHGRLPAHGVYFNGEFFPYDGTGVSRRLNSIVDDVTERDTATPLLAAEVAGLELFALKLRAPRVLQLNSTEDVEAFVAIATGSSSSSHSSGGGGDDDGSADTTSTFLELFAGMESWRQGVNEYHPSPVSEEWTATILRRHLAMPAVAVVGYIGAGDDGAHDDDEDDDAAIEFASASKLLGSSHAHLFFGLVRNASLADSFLRRGWFKSTPAVTVHRPVVNEAKLTSASSGISALAPTTSLALDFFFPDPQKYGPLSMTSWLATHTLPVLGQVAHHTFGVLAEPDLPIVVLFLDLGGDSWSGDERRLSEYHTLLSALETVALEFRGQLVFGYANGIALDRQMRGLGLLYGSAVLPALAVDMRDGLALPFSSDGLNFDDQGNALDVASIRALCHDIVAHRVPDERFYERNPLASPPAAAYTGTEQVLEAMQQATTEADAAAGVEEDRPPAHSEL